MGDDFPYYTMTQAAEIAAESFFTIRNRIRSGVIEVVKTPLGTFIHKDVMNAYLKRRGPKNGRGYYRLSDLIQTQSEESSRDE
jgi:hypothetical protein